MADIYSLKNKKYDDLKQELDTKANQTDLTSLTNIVSTKASQTALTETNKELADLKEALYGYVLDTTNVSITDTIPTTTTIGTTTYNLCDNVRGLVKSVSGNTSKSENLIVLNDVNYIINGINCITNNNIITLNGTATATAVIDIPLSIDITRKANENYCISLFNASYVVDSDYCAFVVSDGSTTIGSLAINGVNKTNVFSGGATYIVNKFRIRLTSGNTYNNFTLKPMLVSGSTAPTTFIRGYNGLKSVEYNGLEIKGRNLWDEQTKLGMYNGNDGTYNPTTDRLCSVNYISVKPNTTYYFTNQVTSAVRFFDKNKNYINGINVNPNSTITTTSDTYYMLYNLGSQYGTTYNHDIAIIEGTSGVYTPYTKQTLLQYPTTLNGVGTAKDTLELLKQDNGLYTLKKTTRIGSVDLGTLSWTLSQNTRDNKHYVYCNSLNYIPRGTELCSGLNYIGTIQGGYAVALQKDAGTLCSHDIQNYLYYVTLNTTISSIISELNGKIFCYELANPTETTLATDLTKEQVMCILQLNGSVDIINSNSEFVGGITTMEMVYKLFGGNE